jgi:hypothetical protein
MRFRGFALCALAASVLSPVPGMAADDADPMAVDATCAQAIAFGASVGNAPTEDDADFVGTHYDLYAFEGSAGDVIAIFMFGDLTEAAILDTFLRLIPEGDVRTVLAEDDDSGGGLNAQVDFTLPADGTYWILASTPYQNNFGGYTLRLDKRVPGDGDAGRAIVPITTGEVVQGELTGLDNTNEEGSPYDL